MTRGYILIYAMRCMACALAALVASGCSSVRPLAEPERRCVRPYAAKNVSDGKLVSVDYVPPQYDLAQLVISPSRMIETNILVAIVTTRNMLDTTDTLGWFDVGKIVEREFDKVVKWNFALPQVIVPSTAEFSFSIDRISLRKEADDVIASLEMAVKISRVGHGDEVAYFKRFSAVKRGPWRDESAVPESFYAALNEIITGFLDDWGSGRGILMLKEWAKKPGGVTEPGPWPTPKPPTIVSSSFTNQNGVCCGTCEVAYNDYDVPKANAYALSYIDQQCRDQLGVESERIRIVYDVNTVKDGRGWYEFRAFTRSKDPVLTYDRVGKRGYMTGDLLLMGMTYQQAKEIMENRIQDAMDRVVSPGPGVKGTAIVHFDPPATMDNVYGLLTVPFYLGGL